MYKHYCLLNDCVCFNNQPNKRKNDEKKYCRFCGKEIKHGFIDLGLSPLSNSYIKKENYGCSQRFFPLNVGVCENCFLVQTTGEYDTPEEIFSDYAYFSSYSGMRTKSWTPKRGDLWHIQSNKLLQH